MSAIQDLANSTLSLVIPPPVSSPSGKLTWLEGTSMSVRVVIDAPTRAQRMTISERIANATAVLYVTKTDLPDGPQAGGRLTAAIDGSPATVYEIVHVVNREIGTEESHWEVYVRE